MENWLLKNSNLSSKQLHDLKKEAGFNTLLFLFVITILIMGDRFFHSSKFAEKLLQLLNSFGVSGVYGPNGVPRTELMDKINKVLHIFYSYGYLDKGYQGLTKYNQPYTIFKARAAFISIFSSINIATVRSDPSLLSPRASFLSTRAAFESTVNSTKVYINAPYTNFLLDTVFSSSSSYLRIKPLANMWEYNYIKGWLQHLLELSINGTVPIYMKSHIDFRGRFYTKDMYTFLHSPIIRIIFSPTISRINHVSLQLGLIFINYHFKTSFTNTRDILLYLNTTATWANYRTHRSIPDIIWTVWFIVCNSGALTVIQLDARCSGYQHYAYLTRDTKLATFLGLLGEGYTDYRDLYTTVGIEVINNLKVNNYPVYVKTMKLVDSGQLSIRDMAKMPIIVILYGSNIFGISGQLIATNPILKTFSKDELYIISKTFFFVTNSFTNSASETCKAFGLMVSLSDTHIVTIGVDRFQVHNNYLKKALYSSQIYYNKVIGLKYNVSTNVFDSSKCIKSSFVNSIHRLDRLFILNIIKRGLPILYIHDCIVIDPIRLPQTLILAINNIDNMYKNYTIINLIIGVRGSSGEFIDSQTKLLNLYKHINRDKNLKCSSLSFTLNKGLDIKDVLKLCKE